MSIKPLTLILVLAGGSFLSGWTQNTDEKRQGLRRENLVWEFGVGLNVCGSQISSLPEGQPPSNYNTGFTPGYQLSVIPAYRISRPLAIRSGLIFQVRNNRFDQQAPWNSEYSEKSTSLGLPALVQYSFGYSDVRFHLLSGLQFNCLLKNDLSYSMLVVPGYTQQGTITISFDRKRLFADLQLGFGIRYQVSRIYIGADVLYYIGIVNQNRFSPPRTIYIFQEGEPTQPYFSPQYRNHGLIVNLIIQKRSR